MDDPLPLSVIYVWKLLYIETNTSLSCLDPMSHCLVKAQLVSRQSRLLTCGVSGNLRLWSVAVMADMKQSAGRPAAQGISSYGQSQGITMDDEMSLDGAVTCAQFDDTLDMVCGQAGWVASIFLESVLVGVHVVD